MTLRKWITFGSAAALIAAASACSDRSSSSTGATGAKPSPSAGDTTSQGRRGDNLPRARGADAGVDTTSPSDTSATSGGATDTTKK